MPAPLRILIADDQLFFREMVADVLLEHFSPLELIQAETGRQALAHLEHADLDLLILDVDMPELSGLDTARHIRQHFTGRKKHLPIVGFSASDTPAAIETALQAGMDRYLLKPFGLQHLPQTVRALLNLPPEGKQQRAYDLSFLRDFCDGEEAEVQHFLQKFEQQYPRDLDRLERALQEQDREAVCRAAHDLKPQLLFVGLSNAADIAAAIEREAREGASFSVLEFALLRLKNEG